MAIPGSIRQGIRRISPFAGVFIECVSSFGNKEVRIYVEPPAPRPVIAVSESFKVRKKKEDIFELFIFAKTVNSTSARELGMKPVNLTEGTFDFYNVGAYVLTIPETTALDVLSFSQLRYSFQNSNASIIKYVTTSDHGTNFDEGLYSSYELIGEGIPSISFSAGTISLDVGGTTVYTAENVSYNVNSRIIKFEKFDLLSELIGGGEELVWKSTFVSNKNINTENSALQVAITDFSLTRSGEFNTIRCLETLPIIPTCPYGSGQEQLNQKFRMYREITGGTDTYDSLERKWEVSAEATIKKYNISLDSFTYGEFTKGQFIGPFAPELASDFSTINTDYNVSEIPTKHSISIKHHILYDGPAIVNERISEVLYGEKYLLTIGDIQVPNILASPSPGDIYLTESVYSHMFTPDGLDYDIFATESGDYNFLSNTTYGTSYTTFNGSLLYSKVAASQLNTVGVVNNIGYNLYTAVVPTSSSTVSCGEQQGWDDTDYGEITQNFLELLQGTSTIISVYSLLGYNGVEFTDTLKTYPSQYLIHYPFNINGVINIERSFTSHDQENNITISGVKYVTKANLSAVTSVGNPEVTHWKIIMSSPEAQNVDITEQVRRAFSVQREDGTWDDTEFMNDFALIYFYGYKKTTVIEEFN